MSNKQIIIIGGANGSGKTTLALKYFNEIGLEFLNADLIAKDLENKGIKNAMIAAGRIFFERLAKYLESNQSFILETTLSGSYINKVARKAQEFGYNVKLIYLFLDNAELCVERVKTRVLKGGHDVPEIDIVRRYSRSVDNFWTKMAPLSNSWILMYNGDEGFQQVALGENELYSVENEFLFDKFQKILNNEKS